MSKDKATNILERIKQNSLMKCQHWIDYKNGVDSRLSKAPTKEQIIKQASLMLNEMHEAGVAGLHDISEIRIETREHIVTEEDLEPHEFFDDELEKQIVLYHAHPAHPFHGLNVGDKKTYETMSLPLNIIQHVDDVVAAVKDGE